MVTMAEKLQDAQITQSNRITCNTRAENKRGQWLGVTTKVMAMIGAVLCAWIGYPWLGAAFLSVPVMAVAKALVETTKIPSSRDIVRATETASSASAPTQPPARQDQAGGR